VRLLLLEGEAAEIEILFKGRLLLLEFCPAQALDFVKDARKARSDAMR
jgi:hypothetical protein